MELIMKISSFLMCFCLLGVFGGTSASYGWDIVKYEGEVDTIHYDGGGSTIVLPADVHTYCANIFHREFIDNVKVIDMTNVTNPVNVYYMHDTEDYIYGVHIKAPNEQIAKSWCGIGIDQKPVADVVPLPGYDNMWIIVPTNDQVNAAHVERLTECVSPFVFFGHLNHAAFVQHISRVDARVGNILDETYMYNVIDLAREFTHGGGNGFNGFEGVFNDLSERIKLINRLCERVRQMDGLSTEKKKFIVSELCRSVAYTYDVLAAYSNGFTHFDRQNR